MSPKLLLDEYGVRSWQESKPGELARLRFGGDVREGDIMLIDYLNAEGLPRTWDHVAIVSGDEGTKGEFDPKDRVMHMGYLFGWTKIAAESEAPAVIQFLRWKPSVTSALARAARAGR